MISLALIRRFRATTPHAVLPRAHLSHKTTEKASKTVASTDAGRPISFFEGAKIILIRKFKSIDIFAAGRRNQIDVRCSKSWCAAQTPVKLRKNWVRTYVLLVLHKNSRDGLSCGPHEKVSTSYPTAVRASGWVPVRSHPTESRRKKREKPPIKPQTRL